MNEYIIYEKNWSSPERKVKYVCKGLFKAFWKLFLFNLMIHTYRTEFYIERKTE